METSGPADFYQDGASYEGVVKDQWLDIVDNPADPAIWFNLNVKLTKKLNNPWDITDGTQDLSPGLQGIVKTRVNVLFDASPRSQKILALLRGYGFVGNDVTRLSRDNPQLISFLGKNVLLGCKHSVSPKNGKTYVNWYLNEYRQPKPRPSLDAIKAFANQYASQFPAEETESYEPAAEGNGDIPY